MFPKPPCLPFRWEVGHTGPVVAIGVHGPGAFAGQWVMMEIHFWGAGLKLVPGRTRAVYYDDVVDGQLRNEEIMVWCKAHKVAVNSLYVYDGTERQWVRLRAVQQREARRRREVCARFIGVTSIIRCVIN